MREDYRQNLFNAPHGLSDHRSEAFHQKMIRYFQSNSESKLWKGIEDLPRRNENARRLSVEENA